MGQLVVTGVCVEIEAGNDLVERVPEEPRVLGTFRLAGQHSPIVLQYQLGPQTRVIPEKSRCVHHYT